MIERNDFNIETCPIIGYYDQQRFKQFNPSDCANWYLVKSDFGKKKVAMYPVMGRRHINYLGVNRLVFSEEPRGAFKSINYSYYVVENSIIRVDKQYNQVDISNGLVTTFTGEIFFSFLVTPSITFACFVDGQHLYVYREDTGQFSIITDTNLPASPKYIATFGNRIVVAGNNSPEFRLSKINLGGNAFDPATSFTISGGALFAQESGIVRQFGVLYNTLYIFTDYTTGIWSNSPSVIPLPDGTFSTFPWKKNTSYNWDYGILNSRSLAIGFGTMVWCAQNSEGLIQIVATTGQAPKPISTKAIDILFQREIRQFIIGKESPFLSGNAEGFIYQWENTIFYRISAGKYHDYGILDIQTDANSIEYNFDTKTWHRVIEKNGERNRIQKHVFFNNTHFVTVLGDTTVYEMSGQFYDNERSNPDRVNPQEANSYIREPFRYERVSQLIFLSDYGEFLTEWVQIDFVWGENLSVYSESPFANAEFIIAQDIIDGEPQYIIDDETVNGNPQYLITEAGNVPQLNEPIYNDLFKPHIELYFSDDGGVSFLPADVKEFSQLGVYSWRMRWYQLDTSRNRCYKLVCVSPSPVVVLGATMSRRRSSGGAC